MRYFVYVYAGIEVRIVLMILLENLKIYAFYRHHYHYYINLTVIA